MRILHTVEFYHPSVGGAQEVVKQISERLARAGHSVTVATTNVAQRTSATINGVRVQGFDISGNQVRGYKGDTVRYQEFLKAGDFDVMLNYAAQQWATDLAYPVLDRLPFHRLLAPCGFSGLFDANYAAYFRDMPEIMKRYDHLILHSEITRDAQFIRTHDLKHCSVISNGASAEELDTPAGDFRAKHGIPCEIPLLLTVGSHTGWKGHSLVMEAFRRARIGRAVLVIIGNTLGGAGCLPRCRIQARLVQLSSLGSRRVLLLDPPRSDVIAAYQAADLFVFGSNIECAPIVLFEAAASKTPFISADVGNAREIADWTHSGKILPVHSRPNGIVAAKAADMAGAIEELLGNSATRATLAEAGYNAWKHRFTWDHIAGQYEQLYRKLVTQE